MFVMYLLPGWHHQRLGATRKRTHWSLLGKPLSPRIHRRIIPLVLVVGLQLVIREHAGEVLGARGEPWPPNSLWLGFTLADIKLIFIFIFNI